MRAPTSMAGASHGSRHLPRSRQLLPSTRPLDQQSHRDLTPPDRRPTARPSPGDAIRRTRLLASRPSSTTACDDGRRSQAHRGLGRPHSPANIWRAKPRGSALRPLNTDGCCRSSCRDRSGMPTTTPSVQGRLPYGRFNPGRRAARLLVLETVLPAAVGVLGRRPRPGWRRRCPRQAWSPVRPHERRSRDEWRGWRRSDRRSSSAT